MNKKPTYNNDSDYQEAIAENQAINHFSDANFRQFLNFDTNISVKSEYNRSDYNYFRPSTILGNDLNKIMNSCDDAYNKIGIIKNVIDLMADFGCKGIRLQHKNPQIQNFYNQWFIKVGGKLISERFLNYLYRLGNVAVIHQNAKIKKGQESEWRRIYAELSISDPEVAARNIPIQYNFLNPSSLQVIGGEFGAFIGSPVYQVRINQSLLSEIKLMKNADPSKAQEINNFITPEIKKALEGNKNLVTLDSTRLHIYHYKKDDWKPWALPMIYSIWDDLVTLEKMRLADIAALDGAYSNIRLWNYGIIDTANPKNSILPTRQALAKLRNILHNSVGGGTMDLVWGPELKFTESKSEIYKFLGSEKYENTLNMIYDAMGVPSSLRSGGKNTASNGSFIALKTLVERLQYGRDVLIKFWQEQVKLVQQAMGFNSPAHITFDQLILSDESTYLQLLLNLADRDIISDESLQEKFDLIPEVEKSRTRRETNKRGGTLPQKASPFHNPLWTVDYEKNLLNMGVETNNNNLPKYKVKGTPGGNGRPKNVKETKKRKAKPMQLPAKASNEFITAYTWSCGLYSQINDVLSSCLLKQTGKKTLRELTNEQAQNFEILKFATLCGVNLYSDISKEEIIEISKNAQLDNQVLSDFETLVANFIEANKRQPRMDELRNLYISIYVREKTNAS